MKIHKDKVLFFSSRDPGATTGIVVSKGSHYISFASTGINIDYNETHKYMPRKIKYGILYSPYLRNYEWVQKSEDT